MTVKRLAAYIGCASLAVAWIASAANSMRRDEAVLQPAPPPGAASGTESLAAEVEAQATRLRERLSAAPTPRQPSRNPFAFAPREPRERVAGAAAEPVATAFLDPGTPPEPLLALIGIAEDRTPDGAVRTAIVTSPDGELYMVAPGAMLGSRYRVAAVAPDAVELTDLLTGGTRRLVLR